MDNTTLTIVVAVFVVGFFWFRWIRSSMVVTKVKKLIDEGEELVIVDVRTRKEHAGRHISGSINVPLETLKSRIARIAPHKNVPVAVYCESGSRSSVAASTLKSLGYEKVYNLRGIGAWRYGTVEGQG